MTRKKVQQCCQQIPIFVFHSTIVVSVHKSESYGYKELSALIWIVFLISVAKTNHQEEPFVKEARVTYIHVFPSLHLWPS